MGLRDVNIIPFLKCRLLDFSGPRAADLFRCRPIDLSRLSFWRLTFVALCVLKLMRLMRLADFGHGAPGAYGSVAQGSWVIGSQVQGS